MMVACFQSSNRSYPASWSTQNTATSGSPSTLILLASGTARKMNYQDGIKQLPMNYNR